MFRGHGHVLCFVLSLMAKQTDPFEEMRDIADEFRHMRSEHAREGERGSWRRRQAAQLQDMEKRFEALLDRWVHSDDEREQWLVYLRQGGEAPMPPSRLPPLVFKGRSDFGSVVEIREMPDDHCDIIMDGHVTTRMPSGWRPGRVFRIEGNEFSEVTDAPAEALEALRAHVAKPEGSPPWQWAPALLEEGLIDVNFAVTERGRQLLSKL